MNFFDQFTEEQMRAGFKNSAEGIKSIIDNAEQKGLTKTRGESLEFWKERYAYYIDQSLNFKK